MSSDSAAELRDILRHYDLGDLAALERNERGYVNTSFAIDMVKDGKPTRYFLRKYKRGVREEEIEFEHSVIERLVQAGSPPVARLHPTREGRTYLHRVAGPDDREGIFYAIFDFLPDDDRYTWVGPRCQPLEIRNSAIVQAQFHRALEGFTPRGQRAEVKILDLLPQVGEYLAGVPQRSKKTVFDSCLIEHLEFLQHDLRATLAVLAEPEARRLPQTIIHCDYHPGNLKFRGSEVTGLFDFDWSKLDLRAFDVALALWYFFATWEGEQDGELRLADVALYLAGYQSALAGQLGLAPLSASEGRYLPHLINAASHYVLNWTVLDFYNKEVDPQEYLTFLRHSLNFTRWFRAPGHLESLRYIIAPLTAQVA
ncbi:MAG: phosphotransferase [Chloroflexi bacterium]|nr:phosphotransferase [Chloroflexota bacterium]